MFRVQSRQRRGPNAIVQAVRADVLWNSLYLLTRQQRPNLIISSSGEIAEQIVIEPAHERAQRKEVGSGRFRVVPRHFRLFHTGILPLQCSHDLSRSPAS